MVKAGQQDRVNVSGTGRTRGKGGTWLKKASPLPSDHSPCASILALNKKEEKAMLEIRQKRDVRDWESGCSAVNAIAMAR
jgi:hypothetical protein